MAIWVRDMGRWVPERKGMSRGTGSGRPGGWLALVAALAVMAAAPDAENAGQVAGSPSEVAGLLAGCGPGAAPAAALGLRPVPVPATRANGPDYYRFPMVSTRRVPGTGNATGVGEIVFARSPFGISLTEDGSYLYDFTVRFERLNPARTGTYVVWTTTPELDEVVPVGEMTDPAAFSGKVAWNKFLVVVTLEPAFDPDAATWTGPIVIRGMSRSGMMHTMAGHGPFEQENCAAYGYE